MYIYVSKLRRSKRREYSGWSKLLITNVHYHERYLFVFLVSERFKTIFSILFTRTKYKIQGYTVLLIG